MKIDLSDNATAVFIKKTFSEALVSINSDQTSIVIEGTLAAFTNVLIN
jgi:hypothetical protein